MGVASFSHGDLCNILCPVGHSYSNFTLFHPHCHFQLLRQFAFRITALNSNRPHLNHIHGPLEPLGWSDHSSAGHQRPSKLWVWPTPPTSSPTIPLPLYAPNHLQFSKASSYVMPSCLHMCMTLSEMPTCSPSRCSSSLSFSVKLVWIHPPSPQTQLTIFFFEPQLFFVHTLITTLHDNCLHIHLSYLLDCDSLKFKNQVFPSLCLQSLTSYSVRTRNSENV